MPAIKVITTVYVHRLKQKARKLKREKNITHTQALDEVAKGAKFNHWHEVVKANSYINPAENALANGCVLAFESKVGMDIDTSDGVLIEDQFLQMLTRAELFEIYSNFTEEDDTGRQLKEIYSENELKEHFESECDFVYFRLKDPTNKTISDILELIKKYSFWPADYIWLNGELIDTRNIQAHDKDGKTVGIRF